MNKLIKTFDNLAINNEKYIIKIQSIVRMYLVYKKILIPSAKYQTKNWRKNRSWYSTGKRNECEIYQIKLIELITNNKLLKTFDRINIESITISDKFNPIRYADGYEYTENFDGIQKINNKKIYYNLKFVCDSGGAQTRSLREVYHFIKLQIKILKQINNIYFINILDGDQSYKAMDKFNYLIQKNKSIQKNIFIGDMNLFQIYWSSKSI